MSQNHENPNRSRKQGQVNHRPRGQLSSDLTPQSPRNSAQAPFLPIFGFTPTTPQRHSDPVEDDSYGAQHCTIPYWDDSNGAIYPIPSIPPRHPGRFYAETVGGGPYAHNVVEGTAESESIHHVPRDSEPGGFNPNLRRMDAPHRPSSSSSSTRNAGRGSRRLDFVPYFDPADARNDDGLRKVVQAGRQGSSLRSVLDVKDINQILRHDATEKIKIATSKRDASKINAQIEKQLPLTLVSKAKSEVLFESPGTKEARSTSTLVEEPSPLQVFKKNNPRPTSDRHPSSSTIDRIQRLRAEEQMKTPAKLEGKLKSTDSILKDEYILTQTPKVPAKSTARNLDLESNTRKSMAATVQSVDDDDTNDHDDVDTLAKAVAVPADVDLVKIAAAKQQLIAGKDTAAQQAGPSTQAQTKDGARDSGVDPLQEGARTSVESFATGVSEEYERVGTPTSIGTEENGVKKKWYKGFRRS